MASSEVLYAQTANPGNKENTRLHASRYREKDENAPEKLEILEGETAAEFLARQEAYVEKRRQEFQKFYEEVDWRENKHMHLFEDMSVTKVVMDALVQRFMFNLQTTVVDKPYNKFGKVADSWEDYTLMFRNGSTLAEMNENL